MRRWTASLALLASITLATPALAEGLNSAKAGLTSLGQAPADLVWHVIFPPDDFVDELPFGQVTGRVLGLVSGPILAVHRAAMGLTDLLFTPFWVLPVMSPEPRWRNVFCCWGQVQSEPGSPATSSSTSSCQRIWVSVVQCFAMMPLATGQSGSPPAHMKEKKNRRSRHTRL